MRLCIVVCLIFFIGEVCSGQSINVAIGPTDVVPDASYAAAGMAGHWNAIEAQHGSAQTGIVDIDGNPTIIRIRQIGGMNLYSFDDLATVGEDATLMDHCQMTFSAGLETCIFIDFLEPGDYEVLCYAWKPGAPDVRAYVNCDEEPGNPHKIVEGGVWPGQHEEFVTYSSHLCVVAEGTNGLLRIHSGVVPGDSPALGAAMNGFQVRKIDTGIVGDVNCDGVVNLLDVGPFVDAIADNVFDFKADINGDGVDNLLDVNPFVSLLSGG